MTAEISMRAKSTVDQSPHSRSHPHSRSYGHNLTSNNMQKDANESSCLQSQTRSQNSSNQPLKIPLTNSNSANLNLVENDPLEHPETIEVVKQSDTTVDIEEDDSHAHNISFLSLPPIRNLMGAFEDIKDMKEEHLLLSPEDRNLNNSTASSIKHSVKASPTGVVQYSDKDTNGHQALEPNPKAKNPTAPSAFSLVKIDLPKYEMFEGLQLSLSQSVINRCSFYSVIHGVNKEVNDMASQDQTAKPDDVKDEGSALVRAVSGLSKQRVSKETSQVDLAVLDEEKFLLAAIASRSDEEMRIRACPASFAEAIGEVDAMTVHDNGFVKGHSENPLAGLATSKTQLWKPSRSWWEAKSGKNPWIEPRLHNKRWRYLWPLIHYHKFLAKCVKKLKRNNVDVKTSLSPVSAFLREEVCAVSDHLAAVSKFTSEEWMEVLPKFNGWTNACGPNEQRLRQMISTLPMRTLIEPTDVDSPLLRDQIDQSFLKAMAAAKEQMIGDAYKNSDSNGENSAPKPHPNEDARRYSMKGGASRPPRYGNRVSNRGQAKIPNGRKNYGARQQRKHVQNGYHNMNQMMPHQMHPGMYQYPDPYQGGQMQGHYMQPHPENSYYYGGGWMQQPLPNVAEYDSYGHGEYNGNGEMQYYSSHNGHVQPNGNWVPFVPHQGQDASRSVSSQSLQGEDIGSQCSDSQICEPEGVSLSFIGPKVTNTNEVCHTPSKQTPSKQTPLKEVRNNQSTPNPPSPYWGHLTGLTMSGLATPVCGRLPQSPHYGLEQTDPNHGNSQAYLNNPNAKPLLMNNYNHVHQNAGYIPPSPATQFLMSPQANPLAHAYFAHGNVVHQYASSPSDQSFRSAEKMPNPNEGVASISSADKDTEATNDQDSETCSVISAGDE